MQTIGEKLQEARQLSGWTLEDVSKRTKIPIAILESIEKNEFQKLPSPTYAIGFIRNYAKLLGLNDREIVSEFIQQEREASDTHLDLRDEVVAYEQKIKSRKYISVLFIVLLFGSLGYFLFQYYRAYLLDKGKSKEKNISNKQHKPEISLIGRYQRMMVDKKTLAFVPKTEVTLHVVREVFVSVFEGDDLLFSGVLKEGTAESWKSEGTLRLKIGSPDAVRLFIKKKDCGLVTREGAVPHVLSVTGMNLRVSAIESQINE